MVSQPAGSGIERATARLRGALSRHLGIDRRALAAFRIALGAVLLADLSLRSRSIVAFYTDAGVLPRSTLAEAYPIVGRVSLHALSGGVALQVGLFAIAGLAALSLLAGHRTRFATAVSLVLLASLDARNPIVLNAGDAVLLQLLFWSLFLPLGARWSLDAAGTAPGRERVASVATAALLLQVVVVYVVNAAHKFRGDRWLEGTAVEYVFNLDHLTVWLGNVLVDVPWLLSAATVGWLAMLVLSPLLVGLRGRPRAVLAALFAAAHLGMALTMQIGVFPLVSIAALLPFLPASVWDAVEARVARPLDRRLSGALPARRSPIPRLAPRLAPSPVVRRWTTRVATAVVTLGLVLVLGYNAATVATGTVDLGADSGLEIGEPRWRMFAPSPPVTAGWYVVRGDRPSGEAVDPFRGGPVRWDRPPDMADTYPTHRWQKYLTEVRWRGEPRLVRSLAGHLCRRGADRGVASVDIYFVAEVTNLDGPEQTEPRRLGRFDCSRLSRT